MSHSQMRLKDSTQFGLQFSNYLIYGGVALILSWVLTGCRFGNQVEEKDQNANSDTISGYYKMEPKSYGLCAQLSDTDTPTCAEPSTKTIPQDVNDTFSNPIAILLRDASNGRTQIFNPFVNNPSILEIAFDTSSRKTEGAGESSTYLDSNKECYDYAYLLATGELNDSNSGQVLKNKTIRGSFHFQWVEYHSFNGSCANILSLIKDCYVNQNNCGQSSDDANFTEHTYWVNFFKPYIDAQVISVAEIPKLVEFFYQVNYQ